MEEVHQEPVNISNVSIEEEMRGAYLDYAMSVIVGRALPDFKDGLKPVHRRILYAMHELNNYHDKPYKKSARVVGDVIGKYHPHGDTAVYDSIVRLAQDFSMRYGMVDGQGNFGSIDGDSPAAMRYTEIRLSKISGEFLSDLEKETVDFVPNYDGTLNEPQLLPAKIPNYLVNGSNGIAVGMATSVPPHNLSEVIKGTIATIDNPAITVNDLLSIIPGPDFPTSGIIYGRDGIVSAYSTGKGIIRVRARAEIELDKKGNERIIVSEIPFQVNKARLIEKIAELVRDKKVEGIGDIRDESSRLGLRVVIEIKKGHQGNVILNQLFKFTAMESTFGIIMLGLDGNQPRILSLKEYLKLFIEFRKDVVTKRLRFELNKAENRAHILLGLKIAVENIDAVVALVKKSASPAEAKTGLMETFTLSEIQAQAILDLRLQRLTALERDKIVSEYEKLLERIKEIKEILADDARILKIVREELEEVDRLYGDKRKTEIVGSTEDLSIEDLITEEDVVVSISHSGYIKRQSLESFKAQKRGGKGVRGQALKEDDVISDAFVANTHNYILCFSDKGKCYWLKVHRIPPSTRGAKGKPIVNLINISGEEKIVAMLPVKEFTDDVNIILVSKRGYIKKTSLMHFAKPKTNGKIAVTIAEGDDIREVHLVSSDNYILLSTLQGKSICFSENDVSEMGRLARGVRGINLNTGDSVVGVEVISDFDEPDSTILTVFENGYGKRTVLSEFRIQSRGGKGIIAGKMNEKGGNVISVLKVKAEEGLMLISDTGQTIRIKVNSIRISGRTTQGVKLMNLAKNETIVAVVKVLSEDSENGEAGLDNGQEEGNAPA
ncbi:MAG: DNA gyrase subunit A [Oligoflexia bacterium]|nr:DNA gyrase subunit A [Oligoflexia bacterium]